MKDLFKKLFIEASDNTVIQFIRYIFVGGAAFVADAGSLWILDLFVHYMLATAAAFIIGLIVNYLLSKLLVFTDKSTNAAAEFIVYGVIGVIGLGITELLMYLLVGRAGIAVIAAKIIAAAIVLVWNFGARKVILYRGGKK